MLQYHTPLLLALFDETAKKATASEEVANKPEEEAVEGCDVASSARERAKATISECVRRQIEHIVFIPLMPRLLELLSRAYGGNTQI